MDTLRCTLHRGLAGHAELREPWERLGKAAPGRFFCEWAWYGAVLTALDPETERFVFALLKDGDEPVAVVPLREQEAQIHRVPVRTLLLPNQSNPPLAGILCRPGLRFDEILSSLVEGLQKGRVAWDVLDFEAVLAESVLAGSSERYGLRIHRQQMTTCDQLVCDAPWDQIAARFSPNFRSNLNKARNKLAKEAEVRYAIVDEPAALRELLPHYMKLEASGWKGKEGTSMGQDPRVADFYRRVLEHYAPLGRARINTLSLGDRYIAMQYCLVDGDTLYIIKLAYDEDYAKLGPGNALIQHIATGRSFRYLNLVGSPVWFRQWKPEQQAVLRQRVFNLTPRGALALGALRAVDVARPWVHRLREARAARRQAAGGSA